MNVEQSPKDRYRNGRLGNKRTSGAHPDYSIIKIGYNIEKSPRDLRRLAVMPKKSSTSCDVKNSQELIVDKKKRQFAKIVDFAVPADHRIKLKESEKKDKYLAFARKLKKPWN